MSIIFSGAISLGVLFYLVFLEFTNAELFTRFLEKDHNEGLIEHGTVLVLVPGILAGIVGFIKYRHRLPSAVLAYWFLGWGLAMLFFAGEEMSWGQWFFKWETPELMQEWNDQGETNLHNMGPVIGPLFDQIPRAIVEILIITGCFWAIRRVWQRNAEHLNDAWQFWICPSPAFIPSALILSFICFNKQIYHLPLTSQELFKSGELGEFYVALALSTYLVSFYLRVRSSQNGYSAETA